MQQFLLGQPLAIVFALNEAGQHVAFAVARFGAASRHQDFQISEKIRHGLVAAGKNFRGDHGLERAQNRQRPVAQGAAFVLRHIQHIADDLDRDRGGEVVDQIDAALG